MCLMENNLTNLFVFIYLQGVRQKELPREKEDCAHHVNLQISHQRAVMPKNTLKMINKFGKQFH